MSLSAPWGAQEAEHAEKCTREKRLGCLPSTQHNPAIKSSSQSRTMQANDLEWAS